MHGDRTGAGVLREVVGAGDELDACLVVMKMAGYGFEPHGAFEPPVAEELGVEGRAEDGWDGVAEVFVEGFADEGDEVCGVFFDAFGGLMRVVELLVAHVYLGASDAPVAVSAGPAFFVEVEIVAVAGVACVAGPDLYAGAWVAGENGGGVEGFQVFVGAGYEVGMVEAVVVVIGWVRTLRRGGYRRRRSRESFR